MAKRSPTRKPAVVVAARLAKVAEAPIAPDWMMAAATGTLTPSVLARVSNNRAGQGLEAAMQAVYDEGQAAVRLREALIQLPPAWPPASRDDLL